MLRSLAAAALLVAVAAPAMAQTSYYVVQDVKTKHCSVIDKAPVATEYTSVGPDGMVYKTRTEAESAMKTVKVCHTD